MSTFQLSFKTKLGVITVKESEGYITDINFIKIKLYLDKKIKKFSFKSKIVGTETQLKVWNEIKKIGYGKTVSYNLISKRTKIHPRHVGRICGQNRLLLFIPCHRVIRCDGLLGGFSAKGGVNLKNKILKFEKLNK
jgi:O-6-methylguanine DNA methyltransferase